MVNQRLRGLRHRKGLTLDALAELSGVNRGTIHRIELNQVSPRIDTLQLLCRAMGFTLEAFFALEEGAEAPPSANAEESDFPGPTGFQQGTMVWLEHLQALLQCSAEAFTVLDGAGFSLFESDPALLMLGGSLIDRREAPWWEASHAEDRVGLRAAFAEVLEVPDRPRIVQHRIHLQGGGVRWIRSTFSNHLGHPAIQGVLVNSFDISDARQAEEDRLLLHRRESQLAMLGAMTARFSNLLAVLQGGLDLMGSEAPDPALRANLQVALDNGTSLIRQMRDTCGPTSLPMTPLEFEVFLRDLAAPPPGSPSGGPPRRLSVQEPLSLSPQGSPVGGSRALRGVILLVEDEDVVRFTTSLLLERLGLEVLQAADGLEALETYRLCGPTIDLVLLDLQMPLMDGRETYAALQKLNPRIRVALCTGSCVPDLAATLDPANLVGVLQKPYRAADLESLLAQSLGA